MSDQIFDTSIIDSWNEICSYQQRWDELVAKQLEQQKSAPITGVDGTQRFEWARALAESRNLTTECKLIVISRRGEPEALLLIIPSPQLERSAYVPLNYLYSGRTSVLLCAAERKQDLLSALIGGLNRVDPNWSVFSFFCFSHSEARRMQEVAAALGYSARVPQKSTSPFLTLPNSIEQMVAARPKKFRYLLRNSKKQLSERGELGFWHSDQGADPLSVIEPILEIERTSWKEEAGSSITSNPEQEAFYRNYLPNALSKGQVKAYFLTLDGRCIAYVLGLIDPPVFCDLKESYVSDMADFSPSHVLKLDVFEDLISQGVTCYDFMGDCEPYKMKWGADIYEQFRIEFYNQNKIANFVRNTRRWLRAKLGDTTEGDF